MNNIPYFLALNRIPQIGPRRSKILLGYFPNLEELFSLSCVEMEKAGISPLLAKALQSFPMATIEEDLRWEQLSSHHHILTQEHPLYPPLLKEIPDAPMVLYAKGDSRLLSSACFSMVGTRKPSITGVETAYQFAYELGQKGLTIVSGLALGIDGHAHRGALDAKGKTIAVMGTGIDRLYPSQHQDLALKISEQGLLLTEFPLQSPPLPGHFPQRNRIISGLSKATLVVEAALRSGSLITAKLALEQNREVMAIPSSIFNSQSKGCHHLLQQGARLITSTAEILSDMGFTLYFSQESAKPLASSEENLVKFIGFEVTSIEKICERSSLSIETIACNLAALEIEGKVRSVPGGYIRCQYER